LEQESCASNLPSFRLPPQAVTVNIIYYLIAILCSANNVKAIHYFALANDSWLKEFRGVYAQTLVNRKQSPLVIRCFFREDACQVRDANANKVFAGLRKMAKFIIDKDKKTKQGKRFAGLRQLGTLRIGSRS
jgi:hypothetical protein